MKRKLTNIMVTGGCGFIGTNFIKYILSDKNFTGNVINVDCVTYAGNTSNHIDTKEKYQERYAFEESNICDYEKMEYLFEKYNIDTVIHFAAESHVDRSITGPKSFIETNINGTFNLIEVARKKWANRDDVLFHHISTDEVYGTLGETGHFFETTKYDPRSPYSASKAASDHLVSSYFHTYGLPVTMSNCSNNYGAYQFPEKLIPLLITNILKDEKLPVYGDGKNVRDWIHVDDHNRGVWKIVQNGRVGETYNLGGENELRNIDLVNIVCEIMAKKKNKDSEYYKKLICFVEDRLGHDRRYAVNCDKLKSELGWKQKYGFVDGLESTIDWYLKNEKWVRNIIKE